MSEIAVENVDVAGLLASEGIQEKVEQVKELLKSVPEVDLLMKAAETVEDVYEIVKKFSTATFEQVKVIFQKTWDYYKESKALLTDEILDNVVGGFSFSKLWASCKDVVIGASVFVASIVVGAVAGACIAGPIGAVAGAVCGVGVGVFLGIGAGMVTNAITGEN